MRLHFAPLFLFAGLAGACSSTTQPKDARGGPIPLTALPRALTASEVQVRDASNNFSFALLRSVTDSEPAANTFISPLSVSFALGMTMNGAAGGTLTEMQSALQLGALPQSEINAAYKSLTELLQSLDSSVQMRVANSIWYRNDFTFKQTFIDTTRKYFNAEVRGLDFGDPQSPGIINNWVSTATNTRIPKVIDRIRSDDVMFLINAIYFKGSWRTAFDLAQTRTGTFITRDGRAQSVPLMHRTDTMSYAETESYQAVDLPYGNTAFSMTVLLPKAGADVNALARTLSGSDWQQLTQAFHTTNVSLTLPRLKLSYERTLNGDLKALGMRQAFDPKAADFAAMTPRDVYLSFVKQNAFVDINEEGTEAAAVTTVGVSVTSAPLLVSMRVDRPYIFVLRERLSGTILFAGRIVEIPN